MSDRRKSFEFDRYINGQLMAEGVTIEMAHTLEEASIIAARIASRGKNGEQPVLVLRGQLPPAPQLTPLERELLDALKLFKTTIIGEIHDKWDEGMRAGKLIVALANPSLKYRADISSIHAVIAKAEAIASPAPEASPCR